MMKNTLMAAFGALSLLAAAPAFAAEAPATNTNSLVPGWLFANHAPYTLTNRQLHLYPTESVLQSHRAGYYAQADNFYPLNSSFHRGAGQSFMANSAPADRGL